MVMGAFFSVAIGTPAHAEASAETFIRMLDDKSDQTAAVFARSQLHGYAIGLGWANQVVGDEIQRPLYCVPEALAITSEQNVDIFRRFVEQNPGIESSPAGLVLLYAYARTFPCN